MQILARYNLILSLLLISAFGCKSPSVVVIADCNKDEVIKITDKVMKKNGYKLSRTSSTIVNLNDSVFLVQYMPVDSFVRGGDAEIEILKKDCSILKMRLGQ